MRAYFREDIQGAYRTLGVPVGAHLALVKAARRKLVLEWHPDRWMHNNLRRAMGEAKMKEVNSAYLLLEHFLQSERSLASVPERWPQRGSVRRRERWRLWRYLHAPRLPWWKMGEFAFARPEFFGPSALDSVKKYAVGTGALAVLGVFSAWLQALPEWALALAAASYYAAIGLATARENSRHPDN